MGRREHGRSGTRGDRHPRRGNDNVHDEQSELRTPAGAAQILELQARVGNRGVASLVSAAPRVHRAGDPDAVEAAVARIDAVLDPDSIGKESAGTSPVQTSPNVQRDGRKGDSPPRKATPGDVLKAVLATPQGKKAITAVKEEGKRVVRRASTGEKAAMIVSGVLIGGGPVAGALTDPDARKFLLPKLSGKKVAVPGVDGLSGSVSFDPEGRPTGGMVYLDVGRYLPRSLGFGPK